MRLVPGIERIAHESVRACNNAMESLNGQRPESIAEVDVVEELRRERINLHLVYFVSKE